MKKSDKLEVKNNKKAKNSFNNKNGFSLIILVVTIIVMLILTSAIIITVQETSAVDKAGEAAIKSDFASIKDKWQEEYTNNVYAHLGRNDEVTDEELQNIIPEEYKGELIATKEGISYIGDDELKKQIAEELGFNVE